MKLHDPSILAGATVIVGSLKFLKVPAIRRDAFLPVLAGIGAIFVIFFTLISLNYFLMSELSESFGGGSLVRILSFFVGILLFVGSAAVLVLGSVFLVNLVAAFFNERLARTTLTHLTQKPFIELEETLVAGMKRSLGGEIRKFLYFLKWFIAILLLNLLPGIGTVLFSIAGFCFTIYALGFEFLSIPLDLEKYDFAYKKQFIHRRLSTCLGLGFGIFISLAIPIFNLLYLPLAVIGASRIVHASTVNQSTNLSPDSPVTSPTENAGQQI